MFSKLASKYGLLLLLKFGSTVKGFTHKQSDTDIAFLASNKLSFEEYTDLLAKLTEIFETEVDLVDLKKAGPLLASEISKNCEMLFGSPEEMLKFRIKTVHEYNDFEPYFRLRSENNKRLIAKNYAK